MEKDREENKALSIVIKKFRRDNVRWIKTSIVNPKLPWE
jgi:hypothetical protein